MIGAVCSKIGAIAGTLSGAWFGGQVGYSEIQIHWKNRKPSQSGYFPLNLPQDIPLIGSYVGLSMLTFGVGAVGGGVGYVAGRTILLWGPPTLTYQLYQHWDTPKIQNLLPSK